MSDIPSAAKKLQIEGARARGATSESLIQTIGGSINHCLDQLPLKQDQSTLNRLKFQAAISGSGTVSSTSAQTIFTAAYYSIVTINISKTGGNGGGRIYLDSGIVYDGTLDIPTGFVPHTFTLFLNAGQALKVANGTYWRGVAEGLSPPPSDYYWWTYPNGSLSAVDAVAWSITGIQFNNQTG